MNTLAAGALEYGEDKVDKVDKADKSGPAPAAKTTTPGGEQETRWKIVTETAGLTPAEIIASRLQAEGIPARAWQEGAGRAYGLTVGLLGTGYVVVPEAHLEQARRILADSFDEEE